MGPVSDLRPLTSGLWRRFLPIALFSVLWLDLIRLLSGNWDAREQYAYGWFVPFFALALLWRRWLDRPRPEVSDQWSVISDQRSVVSGPRPCPIFHLPPSILAVAMVLLALGLLPLRVIFEINTDWPLIAWAYTLIVVVLTLYAFHLAGPRHSPLATRHSSLVSPWVRHFAFPVAFILVALVWPYRIENALTQNLMQVVATLTVEILGWLDVPALQRGNLIEVSTGVLGVDEACSGIRSFQSTLMAGLLMGELYRLRLWARGGLVAGGLLLAFGFNVIRTLVLSWRVDREGMSALDKWHDPAGFTIAIACFFVLWAVAVLIKRWPLAASVQSPEFEVQSSGLRSASTPSSILHPPTSPGTSAPAQPSTLNPQLSETSSPSSVVSRPSPGSSQWSVVSSPRSFLYAVGIWSILTIAFTEAWYRSHAFDRADTAQWWVSYPTNLPSFQPVTVSKAAAKLLRHDAESGGTWNEPDGTKWSVFCFRWKEGDPTARMSAQSHRPEYCMVGSGHQMDADLGTIRLPANGLDLPFRTYLFDGPARPLYVFFCLWEDGSEQQSGFAKTKYHARLRSVLDRRRGLGQQTLEIICNGYSSMDDAKNAVQQRLPNLIWIESRRAGTISSRQ